MFKFAKGLAVSAIRPVLKEFIAEESLDGDLISFGLNGSLELHNVKLNVASIIKNYGLVLPLEISAAYVETLRIGVSWTQLLSAPMKIELDGLYIVGTTTKTVSAADRIEADLSALDSIISALKEAILKASRSDSAAATDTTTHKSDASDAKKESKPLISEISQRKQGRGLVMGMVATITDLLQLSIRNVHVRFECNFSEPSGKNIRPPFSVGITLKSLSVSSTDAEGRVIGSRDRASMSFIRKRLQLQDFAVYLDNGDDFRVSLTKGVMNGEMRALSQKPELLRSRLVVATPDVASVASALERRRYLVAPMGMKCDVLINDSGYPPKSELARILRDKLGSSWTESFASALSGSAAPAGSKGTDRQRTALIGSLRDDPLTALCEIWSSKDGAKVVGAAVAKRFMGSIASASGKQAVSVGAGSVMKAESVEMEFNYTPDDPHVGSIDGPVVEWLQLNGLHTGDIIELARQFEAVASMRPPMIELAIHVDAIALAVTSAQYQALMHLLGTFAEPPAVIPPSVDILSLARELGLPDASSALNQRERVSDEKLLVDHRDTNILRLVDAYAGMWRLYLVKRAVHRGDIPGTLISALLPLSTETHPPVETIKSLAPQAAIRMWLVESFFASSRLADGRSALELLAHQRINSEGQLQADITRALDAKKSSGIIQGIASFFSSGSKTTAPAQLDFAMSPEERSKAIAEFTTALTASLEPKVVPTIAEPDYDISDADFYDLGGTVGFSGTVAYRYSHTKLTGWSKAATHPDAAAAEYGLHPLLRCFLRSDDRVEVNGCLYEYSRFVDLTANFQSLTVSLLREISAPLVPRMYRGIPAKAPTSTWRKVRAALRSWARSAVVGQMHDGLLPLLHAGFDGFRLSLAMDSPEIIALNNERYTAARHLRMRHVRAVIKSLNNAPRTGASPLSGAMKSFEEALAQFTDSIQPPSRTTLETELAEMRIVEHATSVLSPFHLLRRHLTGVQLQQAVLDRLRHAENPTPAASPLLRVTVRTSRREGNLCVEGAVDRLDIKVGAKFLHPIQQFVDVPPLTATRISKAVDPLLKGAAATLQEARAIAEAKLTETLLRPRAIDDPPDMKIDMTIGAPRIIIPLNPLDVETDILVLCLGDVTISSSPDLDRLRHALKKGTFLPKIVSNNLQDGTDLFEEMVIVNRGFSLDLVTARPFGRIPVLRFAPAGFTEPSGVVQQCPFTAHIARCKATKVNDWPKLHIGFHLTNLHLTCTSEKVRRLQMIVQAVTGALPSGNTASAEAEPTSEGFGRQRTQDSFSPTLQVQVRAQIAKAMLTVGLSAPSLVVRERAMDEQDRKRRRSTAADRLATTISLLVASPTLRSNASQAKSYFRWDGIDYSHLLGPDTLPIATFSIADIRVSLDMYEKETQVRCSIRAMHCWDLLQINSTGWRTYAEAFPSACESAIRRYRKEAAEALRKYRKGKSEDSESRPRAPSGESQTSLASFVTNKSFSRRKKVSIGPGAASPAEQATEPPLVGPAPPPYPLLMCQLLACAGNSSVEPLPLGRHIDDGTEDNFCVVTVQSGAQTAIDCFIGRVHVLVNRFSITEVLHCIDACSVEDNSVVDVPPATTTESLLKQKAPFDFPNAAAAVEAMHPNSPLCNFSAATSITVQLQEICFIMNQELAHVSAAPSRRQSFSGEGPMRPGTESSKKRLPREPLAVIGLRSVFAAMNSCAVGTAIRFDLSSLYISDGPYTGTALLTAQQSTVTKWDFYQESLRTCSIPPCKSSALSEWMSTDEEFVLWSWDGRVDAVAQSLGSSCISSMGNGRLLHDISSTDINTLRQKAAIFADIVLYDESSCPFPVPTDKEVRLTICGVRAHFVNKAVQRIINWATTGPLMEKLSSSPSENTSTGNATPSSESANLPLIDVVIADLHITAPLSSSTDKMFGIDVSRLAARSGSLAKGDMPSASAAGSFLPRDRFASLMDAEYLFSRQAAPPSSLSTPVHANQAQAPTDISSHIEAALEGFAVWTLLESAIGERDLLLAFELLDIQYRTEPHVQTIDISLSPLILRPSQRQYAALMALLDGNLQEQDTTSPGVVSESIRVTPPAKVAEEAISALRLSLRSEAIILIPRSATADGFTSSLPMASLFPPGTVPLACAPTELCHGTALKVVDSGAFKGFLQDCGVLSDASLKGSDAICEAVIHRLEIIYEQGGQLGKDGYRARILVRELIIRDVSPLSLGYLVFVANDNNGGAAISVVAEKTEVLGREAGTAIAYVGALADDQLRAACVTAGGDALLNIDDGVTAALRPQPTHRLVASVCIYNLHVQLLPSLWKLSSFTHYSESFYNSPQAGTSQHATGQQTESPHEDILSPAMHICLQLVHPLISLPVKQGQGVSYFSLGMDLGVDAQLDASSNITASVDLSSMRAVHLPNSTSVRCSRVSYLGDISDLAGLPPAVLPSDALKPYTVHASAAIRAARKLHVTGLRGAEVLSGTSVGLSSVDVLDVRVGYSELMDLSMALDQFMASDSQPTEDAPPADLSQTGSMSVLDPRAYSLSVRVSLPGLDAVVVHDLGSNCIPLIHLSVSRLQMGYTQFWRLCRQVAHASVGLELHYYNANNDKWEPCVEEVDIDVQYACPQPLSFQVHTGMKPVPIISSRYPIKNSYAVSSALSSMGQSASDRLAIDSVTIDNAWQAYHLEDSIRFLETIDSAEAVTTELSRGPFIAAGVVDEEAMEIDLADSEILRLLQQTLASTVDTVDTSNHTASVVRKYLQNAYEAISVDRALLRTDVGQSASTDAVNLARVRTWKYANATSENSSKALSIRFPPRYPEKSYVEWLKSKPIPRPNVNNSQVQRGGAIDLNAVPADAFLQARASRSININLSHAFITSVLGFQQAKARYDAGNNSVFEQSANKSGTLCIRNSTELTLRCSTHNAEKRLGVQLRADNAAFPALKAGASGPLIHEHQSRSIENNNSHTAALRHVCTYNLRHDECALVPPLGVVRGPTGIPLLYGPLWSGILVAGPVLVYDATSDAWNARYAAISASGANKCVHIFNTQATPSVAYANGASLTGGCHIWVTQATTRQFRLSSDGRLATLDNIDGRRYDVLPSSYPLRVSTGDGHDHVLFCLPTRSDFELWETALYARRDMPTGECIERKDIELAASYLAEGNVVNEGSTELPPGTKVSTQLGSYAAPTRTSPWGAASQSNLASMIKGRPVIWMNVAAGERGDNAARHQIAIPVDVAATYYLPNLNPFCSSASEPIAGDRADFASLALVCLQKHTHALTRNLSAGLIAEVNNSDGEKQVCFRSTVMLRNELTVPLLICFEKAGSAAEQRIELLPGDHIPVPLAAAAADNMRIVPLMRPPTFCDASARNAFDTMSAPLQTLSSFALSNSIDLASIQKAFEPHRPTQGITQQGLGTRVANYFSIKSARQKELMEKDAADIAARVVGKAVLLRCEPWARHDGMTLRNTSGMGLAFMCAAHVKPPATATSVEERTTGVDKYTTHVSFRACIRLENLLPFSLDVMAYHPFRFTSKARSRASSVAIEDLETGKVAPIPKVGETIAVETLAPGASVDILQIAAMENIPLADIDTTCIALAAKFSTPHAPKHYSNMDWTAMDKANIIFSTSDASHAGCQSLEFRQDGSFPLFLRLEKGFSESTTSTLTQDRRELAALLRDSGCDQDEVELSINHLREANMRTCSSFRMYVPFWIVNSSRIPISVLHPKLRRAASGWAVDAFESQALEGPNGVLQRDGQRPEHAIMLYSPPLADDSLKAQTVLLRAEPCAFSASGGISAPVAINSLGLETTVAIPVRPQEAWPGAAPQVTQLSIANAPIRPLATPGIEALPGQLPDGMQVPWILKPTKNFVPSSTLELGMSIEACTGKFFRTTLLRLSSRVIVSNATGYPIEIMQCAPAQLTASVPPSLLLLSQKLIQSDEVSPDDDLLCETPSVSGRSSKCEWHWPDATLSKTIRLRPLICPVYDNGSFELVREVTWDWSEAFEVADGETIIKLRPRPMGLHRSPVTVNSEFTGIEEGVTTNGVAWLNLQMHTEGATTYLRLLPHPGHIPHERLTTAYTVVNKCSNDYLLIRQRGRGPAAAECVPCDGAVGAMSRPFILDLNRAKAHRLIICARPVGVASLLFLDKGLVGRDIVSGKYLQAARRLASCVLSMVEGGCDADATSSTTMRSVCADGSHAHHMKLSPIGGFSGGGMGVDHYALVDIDLDKVGDKVATIVAGGHKSVSPLNCFGAIATHQISVSIRADASTGATKVVTVSDLPDGPAASLRELGRRIEEVQAQLRAASLLRDCLEELRDDEIKRSLQFVHLQLHNEHSYEAPDISFKIEDPGEVERKEAENVHNTTPLLRMQPLADLNMRIYSVNDQKVYKGAATPPDLLWVQVVSAVNLPGADLDGFSDPFAVLTLESAESLRKPEKKSSRQRKETKHVPKTLDPVWGEAFFFDTVSSGDFADNGRQYLRVRVMDHDTASAPDLLGEVVVDYCGFTPDVTYDYWYPVQYSAGADVRPAGSIRLRILRTGRLGSVNDLSLLQIEEALQVLDRAEKESQSLRDHLISHAGHLKAKLGLETLQVVAAPQAGPLLDGAAAAASKLFVETIERQAALRTHRATVQREAGLIEDLEAVDQESVEQPKPMMQSTTVAGMQLEVSISEVTGMPAQNLSRRYYIAVEAEGVTRRTATVPAGFSVDLFCKHSGIKFARSNSSENPLLVPENLACALVARQFAVSVHSVDPLCLADAVSAEGATNAQQLQPGCLVIGVNGISFSALTFEAAITCLDQAMSQLPTEMDPFVSNPPKARLHFASNSVAGGNLGSSMRGGAEIAFADKLLFGELLPPPTPPTEAWLRHYAIVKNNIVRHLNLEVSNLDIIDSCPPLPFFNIELFERRIVDQESRYADEALHHMSVAEMPLRGSSHVESFTPKPTVGQSGGQSEVLTGPAVTEEASEDNVHNPGPLYSLLGLAESNNSMTDNPGKIGKDDFRVGYRGFVPVPYPGMVSERWVVLDSSRGAKADPPGRLAVKVRVRWVPIYAQVHATRSLQAAVQLAGFGISVVSKEAEEILLLSMNALAVDYATYHTGRTCMQARLQDLQIDCQQPTSLHPVMLSTVAVDSRGKSAAVTESLGINVVMVDHPHVTYVEDVSVLMNRLAIEIDDDLISSLLQFVSSLDLSTLDDDDDQRETLHALGRLRRQAWADAEPSAGVARVRTSDSIHTVVQSRAATKYLDDLRDRIALSQQYDSLTPRGDRIYVGMLRLHPIALNITFAMSGDTRFLRDLLPDIPIFGYFKNVIDALGSTLANIDRAPIAIPSLFAQHVYETTAMLTSRLTNHYVQGAIREWYKVVGSAEFLGNPVGLVSGMGRDVMRLLYEPAAGLLETPSEFGITVATNAYALVRNTTVGVIGSSAKVLNSVSKGVKKLDVDMDNDLEKLKKAKALRQLGQPRNVGEGMYRGALALSGGVFNGIAGIIVSPVKGFRKGFIGGLKGTAGGIVGIVVRPVAGTIDGSVLLLQGIANNVAGSNQHKLRMRLPRYVPPDGTLYPYNEMHAEGGARMLVLHQQGLAVKHSFIHASALVGVRIYTAKSSFSEQKHGVRELQDYYLRLQGDTADGAVVAINAVPYAANCRASFLDSLEASSGAGRYDHDTTLGCIPAVAQRLDSQPAALAAARIKVSVNPVSDTTVAGAGRAIAHRESVPTPYVALLTDRSLFILHNKTNDVLQQLDLFETVDEESVAVKSTYSINNVLESPTRLAAEAGARVSAGFRHVAAGIGAGISKVTGISRSTEGVDDDDRATVPLITTRLEGPVLILHSKTKMNQVSLLCTSAEAAALLERFITLAARRTANPTVIFDLERTFAERQSAHQDMRRRQLAQQALQIAKQRKVTETANSSRLVRLATCRVPAAFWCPVTEQLNRLPHVIVCPSEGGAAISKDNIHSALEATINTARAGSKLAPHFACVAWVQCLPGGTQTSSSAAPENKGKVMSLCMFRSYQEIQLLWSLLPPEWHEASKCEVFVPYLPEKRATKVRAAAGAHIADGEGSPFMLEALSQALTQLVEATRVEERRRSSAGAVPSDKKWRRVPDKQWDRLRPAVDAFFFGNAEAREREVCLSGSTQPTAGKLRQSLC